MGIIDPVGDALAIETPRPQRAATTASSAAIFTTNLPVTVRFATAPVLETFLAFTTTTVEGAGRAILIQVPFTDPVTAFLGSDRTLIIDTAEPLGTTAISATVRR
tara:strand:- start:57 stop:371 length:315 start_codon:yes stop_codon:yes gene_type:complete